MLNREKYLAIVNSHLKNKNLVKHCLAVEVAMKALANYFNEDAEKWGNLGLIHDADWEETQNDVKNHAKKTVEWITEIEKNDADFIQALLAHNYFYNGEQLPDSKIAWALYCSDDLTGLIVASTLVLTDRKIKSLTVDSVLNKFPKKAFARGVNRDQIKLCEEKLNIPLREFIEIILKAMQSIDLELGL